MVAFHFAYSTFPMQLELLVKLFYLTTTLLYLGAKKIVWLNVEKSQIKLNLWHGFAESLRNDETESDFLHFLNMLCFST